MLNCRPITVLLVALMILTGASVNQPGAEATKDLHDLLSIGEPGPSAIALKTWIAKDSTDRFAEGEPITIHFQADQDVYAVVIGVSSRSEILVVFPNVETPNTFVRARKLYSLFDDQSQLSVEAGKHVPGAKLVLYVCAEPFGIDRLLATQGEGWVTIPSGAQDRIKVLKQTLTTISKKRGFNRVALTLDDAQGKPRAVDLRIRKAGTGRALKQLPREGGGDSPETISGSHGLKQLPGEPSGEGPETTGGAQGAK
ncbi:MAG: DUF4384 domain-containing protein [Thermodesulfobacteriota bacterium]